MRRNIICVANPIKEIMSAQECLHAMVAGEGKALRGVAGNTPSDVKVCGFLMSDGGDGFLDAIGQNGALERRTVPTTGPLGDIVSANYLRDAGPGIAYIESANVCGLRLIEPGRRNIMMSGTAGLADVVVAAKEDGARQIYIGLGGSATCDGGVGFLWRLACLTGQFTPDACEGRTALDMAESAVPDTAAIREWLGETRLIVCADVDAPLLGTAGAAQGFAAQKGATPEQVEQLEAWMANWAARVEINAGASLQSLAGAGAAGGLGFVFAAIGAELLPGAMTVMELTGLAGAVTQADLVMVTEGKFDATSLQGKAPWAVAELARRADAAPVIFCGVSDNEARTRAESAGVKVIEFAAGVTEDRRTAEMPGLLTAAVEAYITAAQEQFG